MLAVSSKDQKTVRLGFGRGARHSTQPGTKDTKQNTRHEDNQTERTMGNTRRTSMKRETGKHEASRIMKGTKGKVEQREATEDGSMAEAQMHHGRRGSWPLSSNRNGRERGLESLKTDRR
jgi:hypothetical protein